MREEEKRKKQRSKEAFTRGRGERAIEGGGRQKGKWGKGGQESTEEKTRDQERRTLWRADVKKG